MGMDWEPQPGTETLSAADAWLEGARRYRLLSADDERRCAQAIEQGGKDAPSPVCPRSCCRTARETLIQHNLRLIVDVAKRYQLGATNLTREDLWQYGVEGLMRAPDKFDWRRGFKFSTCATAWIRQAISRHMVDEGYMVREPQYVVTERTQAYKAGHGPADRNIPTSLDRYTDPYSDNPTPLGDILEDRDAQTGFAEADERDRERWLVAAILRHCTRREAVILACRMQGDTLEQLGGKIGLTRERVRQIQLEAIRKLRAAFRWDECAGGLRERASMVQYIQDSIWQAQKDRTRQRTRAPSIQATNQATQRPAPVAPAVTTPTGTREPHAAVAVLVSNHTHTTRTRTRTRRRGTSSVVGDDSGVGQSHLFVADTPSVLSDKPNTTGQGVTSAKRRVPAQTAKGA